MIRATAGPRRRCCSTNSSIIIYALWYVQVRAIFSNQHGELRARTVFGDGNTARHVLQFTHTLERTATSGGSVFTGGVRCETRARIIVAVEVSTARCEGGGCRIGRRVADHSLLDRPPGFGSDVNRVFTEEGGLS